MAEEKYNQEKAIKDLKSVLKTDKVIIGTEETMKLLKNGGVEKVYLAANSSDTVVSDVRYYGDISGVEIIELGMPNDELGVLCQKPYSVSVLSVRK